MILIFAFCAALAVRSYDNGVCFEYDFSKNTVKDAIADFYCGDLSSLEVSDGELQLDLTKLSAADGEYEGVILHGDSLISMNRSGDAQVTESKAFVTVKDGILYAKIQKLSFYEFVICKSRGGI